VADYDPDWLSSVGCCQPGADNNRKSGCFDGVGKSSESVFPGNRPGFEFSNYNLVSEPGEQSVCFSDNVADRIDGRVIASPDPLPGYAFCSAVDRQHRPGQPNDEPRH
jgi:hypothetical protein